MRATNAWCFPREAICPRDAEGLRRWDSGLYRELYAIKHAISAELRPASILEIGVRAGYSAYAFLRACPSARYVGLDAENGRHGGQGGPWAPWAAHLLEPFAARIEIMDTQEADSLERFGAFDLIHIDGDHSKAGCSHDLGLCLPILAPGGAMLVDDYHYIGDVRRAVDAFTEARGLGLEVRRSPRGEAILTQTAGGVQPSGTFQVATPDKPLSR